MMTTRRLISGAFFTIAIASAALADQPTTAPATLNWGDPAPALTVGKWVKGDPVAALEPGKIYVIDFWATWCAPCRALMPHLSELQKKYPDVVFIGQDYQEDDPNEVPGFVMKMGDRM